MGRCRLVLGRHAGEVATLELLTRGFGRVLIETGETGAVERFVALLDALGKRFGGGERAVDLLLGVAEMLPRFILAVEGADLYDPSAMRMRCRRRCGIG